VYRRGGRRAHLEGNLSEPTRHATLGGGDHPFLVLGGRGRGCNRPLRSNKRDSSHPLRTLDTSRGRVDGGRDGPSQERRHSSVDCAVTRWVHRALHRLLQRVPS